MFHIVDIGRFAWEILQYGILSPEWSAWVAGPIAIVEFTLGTTLLLGQVNRSVYASVSVLFSIISIAVLYALVGGREIECGCLGAYSPMISWWHFFFLLALTTWSISATWKSEPEVSRGSSQRVNATTSLN